MEKVTENNLTKLLYLLVFIVVVLAVFQIFFIGRVQIGDFCLDLARGIFSCKGI
jgi:hypothetical protein